MVKKIQARSTLSLYNYLQYFLLGIFPKAFPQAANSQGYLHKWQFPKRHLTKSVQGAALGPFCSMRRFRRPSLWPLGSWEFAHFGSCHLENVYFEVAVGKIPFWKYLKAKTFKIFGSIHSGEFTKELSLCHKFRFSNPFIFAFHEVEDLEII